jgi:transketolase N-terminal domain/subunit
VAQNLNVKLIIDDNDVTIAGFPSDYMKGFDVAKTLTGHGLPCHTVVGEDIDALYAKIRAAVVTPGPQAVIAKRKMAPGT